MTPPLAAGISTLLLRALALLALLLACIDPPGIARDRFPDLMVLADRSQGSPAAEVDEALEDLLGQFRRDNPSGRLASYEFGHEPGPAGAQRDDAPADLAAALWSALARPEGETGRALVVVSDGHGTPAGAGRALAAARLAEVPVYWRAAVRTAPVVRFRSVGAPDIVRRGQRVPLEVELVATRAVAATLVARAPGAAPASHPLTLRPGESGIVRIDLDAAHAGPMKISLSVETAADPAPLAERELLVEVAGPARIAYLGREGSVLDQSLAAGGFEVESIRPRRAPTSVAALAQYSLAVLDDVALDDAPRAFWTALVAAVRDHGLGLVVLGGPASFASGGYRNSPLEPILPVLSEPAAVESPAALVFVVDKSGSMGRSGLAPDRLTHARTAVMETSATLTDADLAALVVFDTEPRVLVPLQPVRDARTALAQPWPVSAGGGTQAATGLELATAMLASAPPGQRIVVLVTDGFLTGDPVDAIAGQLARTGARLIVLGVGADANLAGLEPLVAATQGQLLRVAESAELPRLMRQGLRRLRSRVDTGRVAVSQRVALPFLDLRGERWPDASAYAVTRARPEATVYLSSASGDPLLAAWHAGSGRVVALTTGLGGWTPDWLRWRRWPDLAGGLADWTDGRRADPALHLDVEHEDRVLTFVLDVAADGRWTNGPWPALRAVTPSGRLLELAPAPAGPGRFTVGLDRPEAGIYDVTALAGPWQARRAYLHADRATQDRVGLGPAVRGWLESGLVREWPRDGLTDANRVAGDPAVARRILVALALALLLLALMIDYRGTLISSWPRVHRTVGAVLVRLRLRRAGRP